MFVFALLIKLWVRSLESAKQALDVKFGIYTTRFGCESRFLGIGGTGCQFGRSP